MKPTALGLLIAVAAFGASTLYLSLQLRDERMQADKLAVETRALNARIAELEKARAEHRFESANPFAGVTMPPDSVAMAPPPGVAEARANADTAEFVVIDRPARSEAFTKMMRAQIRSSNKRLYADLGKQLGLSKDEANRLVDLLTDQQVEAFGSPGTVTDPAERRRLRDEARSNDHTEILDLIGPEKAQALSDYQASIPARQELEMLSRQLEGSDASLSDDQRKRLLAIMVEERNRIPAPQMSGDASGENYGKALNEWQADYNERTASQARSILNSEQLTAYNEYLQWQKEMREQMGRMRPGRAQRNSGGPNVMFTTAAPVMDAEMAGVAGNAGSKP